MKMKLGAPDAATLENVQPGAAQQRLQADVTASTVRDGKIRRSG